MIHKVRECLLLIILSAGLMTLSTGAQADDPPTYSLAVVPQFTNLVVHKNWTPIVDYLNRHTPYRFQLSLYRSIPDFEKAFLLGLPDFAYMNPYHAVMAKRAQGYRPVLRDNERKLTGILVVREDSPYRDVAQLEGATIAFPSPNAFGAALYMRALLHEEKKIDFTPLYAGTHSNAYRQVLLGKAAAGGGVYRTLLKERPEAKQKLRVIFETPPTPSHPLAAHARVPEDVSSAVRQAFAAMAADENGAALLAAVQLTKPVGADYGRDYEFLEKLNLEGYLVERSPG